MQLEGLGLWKGCRHTQVEVSGACGVQGRGTCKAAVVCSNVTASHPQPTVVCQQAHRDGMCASPWRPSDQEGDADVDVLVQETSVAVMRLRNDPSTTWITAQQSEFAVAWAPSVASWCIQPTILHNFVAAVAAWYEASVRLWWDSYKHLTFGCGCLESTVLHRTLPSLVRLPSLNRHALDDGYMRPLNFDVQAQ